MWEPTAHVLAGYDGEGIAGPIGHPEFHHVVSVAFIDEPCHFSHCCLVDSDIRFIFYFI